MNHKIAAPIAIQAFRHPLVVTKAEVKLSQPWPSITTHFLISHPCKDCKKKIDKILT